MKFGFCPTVFFTAEDTDLRDDVGLRNRSNAAATVRPVPPADGEPDVNTKGRGSARPTKLPPAVVAILLITLWGHLFGILRSGEDAA